jgi:hypothetical protein
VTRKARGRESGLPLPALWPGAGLDHCGRPPPPTARPQAYRLLKPGGYFAISDFTVTPEHSLLTRTMWPAIFKADGVRPTVEHLVALRRMFTQVHCTVDAGGFPYVPALKAPYYYFVGAKAA